MNKIYSLIHLNNQSYMVDKEAKLKNKDLYYSEGSVTGLGYWNPQAIQDMNSEWLVIAASDKSINLPLLPAIEEGIQIPKYEKKEAGYAFFGNEPKPNVDEVMTFTIGYTKGYKAASAKKYTEEDLLKYMEFRMKYWIESIFKQEFKDHPKPFEAQDKVVHERAVQSLNPLPIAVEVEMEEKLQWTITGMGAGGDVEGYWKKTGIFNLKADEKRFVKVVKWIYE